MKYDGLPVVSVDAQANGLSCLVSDRVSEECKLSSSLYFLSLSAGADSLADKLICLPSERNRRAAAEIDAHYFDINGEAVKLAEWYVMEE